MKKIRSRQLFILMSMLSFSFLGKTQVRYEKDILGEGFWKSAINQPDDYEGKVVCTVVKKTPEKSNKMAVLYVHGFNDYFFQKEMATEFTDKGYAFYAVDLRKYGRSWLSNQKMNNVRNLEEYFADIDTTLKIMKAEGAEKILLYGHSTGGLIVTLYANHTMGHELFDALFLNSPFFDMNLNKVLEKTILPLIVKKGAKNPDKLMKGGLSEWYGLSLHKDGMGEWEYDVKWKPHNAPSVNYGWIKAIRDGQKKVQAGIAVGKPVILMHSDKSIYTKKWTNNLFYGDAVLSVSDIAKYGAKMKGDITTQVVENGMHDLILSKPVVREKVYVNLFAWLGEKMK